MYLLNPYLTKPSGYKANKFTFHYVSIKSRQEHHCWQAQSNLHSTMYLLNRLQDNAPTADQQDLHSTMYLLNHVAWCVVVSLKIAFTFHYVSIKSQASCYQKPFYQVFTFHYVSIKSTIVILLFVTTSAFTFHYVSIKSLYDL